MSADGARHRVGKPLDPESARLRASQAAVLGDALNLRVLSALAAGAPAAELSEILYVDDARIAASLIALSSADIIRRDVVGADVLTADAWVRFGRLLVETGKPRSESNAPALGALPPAIETVARDLVYRFASTFSGETVSRYVAESYLLLGQRARVSGHLSALTARYAADRLDALASAKGLVLRGTPEVLFVCVQNAGRSQMAAAYVSHLAGSAVHVRTAGSAPASEINPRITAALAEVGVPLTDAYPKPLTDEVVQAADYVITMGCGDACPVYPGRRYMEWDLDDPLDHDDEGLREIRDAVRERVERLLEEMGLHRQPARR
ncbi:arsenate reductase/protein-tyrosine-phosphatase family protein [Microbacterium sp. BR1]|uniref:arsenate reductase/protein-tyrosine-phosphatase family protein n=1 Tax=Microbacterium sp. BR1 TaxID=1070896 RepID=UPI000C2C2C02|nr:hypothetical protein [Microbacterium sp. BR1]